jgi:predicted dehydrogenase
MKVLLIGVSQMAVDYYKALSALDTEITIVGRSEGGVTMFKEQTGVTAHAGGINKFILNNNITLFDAVIVAVGLEELYNTTSILIKSGAKKILVEKPAGLEFSQIEILTQEAKIENAEVFVAYNRRFYASVLELKKQISDDGGVRSFHFEFTEWAHVIEKLDKNPGIKENWFLANSTHVVDLAFFIGGAPKEFSAYTKGKLSWHPVSIFAGAGISDIGALFSYHSNWESAGRWSLEFLTDKNRYILKPLEELQVQRKGSIVVEKIEIDDSIDKTYKAGLYKQTEAFLKDNKANLQSLYTHSLWVKHFEKILKGNN